MSMTIDDLLDAYPTLLEREPDASKRQELSEFKARLEEVKHRKLLCDFRGIQVFEYQGKRTCVLSGETGDRMQILEQQISGPVWEMVQDLTSITAPLVFKAEPIPPLPQPLYDENGMVNGKVFEKAASAIWARTAMHRGLWEVLRVRLAPKLNQLQAGTVTERRKAAKRLKSELGDAIDLIAGGAGGTHGASTMIQWENTDGSTRLTTLHCAALKITCALIVLNLKPPTKGEVRKVIEAKWPNLRLTRSGWTKVWRTAGLDWLGRKGKW